MKLVAFPQVPSQASHSWACKRGARPGTLEALRGGGCLSCGKLWVSREKGPVELSRRALGGDLGELAHALSCSGSLQRLEWGHLTLPLQTRAAILYLLPCVTSTGDVLGADFYS